MLDPISFKPFSIASTKSLEPKSVDSSTSANQLSKQFSSFLNDAMTQLNDQQKTVDQLNASFVKGELSDVHQLTIASEKASLGLELTVQVRNKVIEAYQEIMRTQM